MQLGARLHPTLHACCTLHPSWWQRHQWRPQHAGTPALDALLTMGLRLGRIPEWLPCCHAHLGTRPWSQCWSGLIWSKPSGVTVAAAAICPRSLWKSFSGTAVLPLNVFRQFNTDWARSSVRRAECSSESNSTPRKEILCTGASLLFSQLTWRPNWLRWLSTESMCSHNCSRDWARMSQSSRELRMWMPCSLMEQGLPPRLSWRCREIGPAQMTGPCTDMLDPQTQSAETACVEEESRHKSTRPSGRSLQTNLGDGCMRKCISVWAFWTVACEGSDSKLAGPRSVVTNRFSWVQWSKGCKTLTSYQLEWPALSRPSPVGLRSPHARHGHQQLSLKWSGHLWTSGGHWANNRIAEPDGPNEPVRRTGER